MDIDATHQLNAANWVDNYGDSLYAYVMARVANAALSEDIVQETFLSAWKSRNTYNGSASEKPGYIPSAKQDYRLLPKSIYQ